MKEITMPIADPHAEIDRLRSHAQWAIGQATEARALGLDIDVRRQFVLDRDKDCLSRHTAAVWSSRAAERSRVTLQHSIGFSLWMASEGLNETVTALEAQAGAFEETARDSNRQAERLERELLM
ncbi:MAG: hypothetical protein ACI9C1_002941 [Candidatus Aldehydirespiratoraceae bacterium]|jgi:hypothetical protein